MSFQSLFSTIRDFLTPEKQVHGRIRKRIEGVVALPSFFGDIQAALHPTDGVSRALWSRIERRIQLPRTVPLFGVVRHLLEPGSSQKAGIREILLTRLRPVSRILEGYMVLKWGVACVLLLLSIRLVPVLFLPSTSIAGSLVTLLQTRGEVSLSSVGHSWENLEGERVLQEGAVIRTRDGEVTIVIHDDGVIRLAPFTAVELHDLSDRPNSMGNTPTLTLIHGRIWVQGLLLPHLPGVTIATSYGDVLIHEGSVSIEEGVSVVVSVWDRRAIIVRDAQRLPLVAQERTWLWEGNIPVVKHIAAGEYQNDWIAQNISRDAVHQRDIAKWQWERRAEIAGILPTSPFYPVKRVAEHVDTFFTFGKEARVSKKLEQAERRLNEAAALLAEGQEGAISMPLEEYKETMLVLAGDGEVSSTLLSAIRRNTATIAAALPGDDGYILKRAVLEADAAVALANQDESHGGVEAEDAEGTLLIDTLTTIIPEVESDHVDTFLSMAQDLEKYLPLFKKTSSLQPELRKESEQLLLHLSSSLLVHRAELGETGSILFDRIAGYLPISEEVTIPLLTEEQVEQMVSGIKERVLGTFTMRHSRENQLRAELKALEGHPDQARILRRLHQVLPAWYAAYVREEMQKIREDQGLL